MEKVNALAFIGKSHFEFDVVYNDDVLYAAGSPITPDKILKLCFKEFCSAPKEAPVEVVQEIEAEVEISQPEEPVVDLKKATNAERTNVLNSEIDEKPDGLQFDRGEAEIFSSLCTDIAKVMKYHEEALELIKISSYYLKVGRLQFVPEEESEPDFFAKMIEASANKLENMGFAKEVVEGVRNAREIYQSDNILDKEFVIPYSHIISVVLSYTLLMEKHNDKNMCLDIMRKNGVQYFNVFVLHKFINYMRSSA